MRKSVYLIALVAISIISLAACAKTGKSNMKQDIRILVSYFSATGTTKKVAEQIAAATSADICEIAPEKPYTEADLDWTDSTSRSSLEMKDLSSRPAIKKINKNMADYDVVFIGFPIWWYTNPTIINTFIESIDLKGKRLIPFATSGGSTIDKACSDLKKLYPDYNWTNGKLLNSPSDKEIKEWTDQIIKH